MIHVGFLLFIGILHSWHVIYHKPLPGGRETSDWHSIVPPLLNFSTRWNTQNPICHHGRESYRVHCLKLCLANCDHGGIIYKIIYLFMHWFTTKLFIINIHYSGFSNCAPFPSSFIYYLLINCSSIWSV